MHRTVRLLSAVIVPSPSPPFVSPHVVARLNDRSLLRLTGVDCIPFLNALVTTDLSDLTRHSSHTSLYTFLLNSNGRIVHDMFVYSLGKTDVLLETDKAAMPHLANTLIKYRMRKRVQMVSCADTLATFAVFREYCEQDEICYSADNHARNTAHMLLSQTAAPAIMDSTDYTTFCAPDPRLLRLGHRVVLDVSADPKTWMPDISIRSESEYIHLRHRLGIAEGGDEMPGGKAMPLENNAEWTNSVCFEKGCYIGQELTARTHHTGVVRKRIMPIAIAGPSASIKIGDKITAELSDGRTVKNAGVLRALSAKATEGVAVLRVKEALIAKRLFATHGDGSTSDITTRKPYWWPGDAVTHV